MPPYEPIYRRRCWTPLYWSEIGERKIIGPEMMHQTEDKVKIINDHLNISRIDKRRTLI